jgi:hypothetical protein
MSLEDAEIDLVMTCNNIARREVRNMKTIVPCIRCQTPHVIRFTLNEWQAYLSEVCIQHALPHHTAEERELLISQLCSKCCPSR